MSMVRLVKFKPENGLQQIGTIIGIFGRSDIGVVVEIDEQGREWNMFYEPIDEKSDVFDFARSCEGYEAIEEVPKDELIELLETAIKFTYHQSHFTF